jgi:hypothetical protein
MVFFVVSFMKEKTPISRIDLFRAAYLLAGVTVWTVLLLWDLLAARTAKAARTIK